MPAPIMGNHAKALAHEEKHLRVPIVRAERPAVTEDNGLALAPILEINFRPIISANAVHFAPPFKLTPQIEANFRLIMAKSNLPDLVGRRVGVCVFQWCSRKVLLDRVLP